MRHTEALFRALQRSGFHWPFSTDNVVFVGGAGYTRPSLRTLEIGGASVVGMMGRVRPTPARRLGCQSRRKKNVAGASPVPAQMWQRVVLPLSFYVGAPQCVTPAPARGARGWPLAAQWPELHSPASTARHRLGPAGNGRAAAGAAGGDLY